MKKIAIVGTGIAGMGAAHFLHQHFDITLFEKNEYVGGHTNTVTVDEDGTAVPIDTGFIVFNHQTYPNLTRLFSQLGVTTKKCDMSFGVQHRPSGLEYCGSGLLGLFAQRKNIFSARHWRMLLQIKRFNEEATSDLEDGSLRGLSMADYCIKKGFGDDFLYRYLSPMSSALWSTPTDITLTFPAEALIKFFKNHGLLGLNTQYQWYTVHRGSWQYRDKLIRPFRDKIKTQTRITSVVDHGNKVTLTTDKGEQFDFDAVILAGHADQSLAMLSNPTPLQEHLLSKFEYQKNIAKLHTDASVMPKLKKCWSAWNYLTIEQGGTEVSSTVYSMNHLQKVSKKKDYFVSINDPGLVDAQKVLKTITYEHPIFNVDAYEAQKQLSELNKEGNIYFCGSYFRNGFHEDALWSAVKLSEVLLDTPLEAKSNFYF
ncbi:MAG TPA: FAD-dependent oxidoreductase [Luteibaculaceae bacterium]|nr:FAD-dependent oxidoreductase [Luteibaculaceae bacterium]